METMSYVLVNGKKASDAITKLVEKDNTGCSMTCQMAGQLCVYYALLKTLGPELFDKVFTEIHPLILRDYAVEGGQPFIGGTPFTAYRVENMLNVAIHPLHLFVQNKVGSDGKIAQGDTVIFTNFEDYREKSNLARNIDRANISFMNRRMEGICIGTDSQGEPEFFSFGPKFGTCSKQDLINCMVYSHNCNLKIINPKTTLRTNEELVATKMFYQAHMHYSVFFPVVALLIDKPATVLSQMKDYKDAVAKERGMIDKLPVNEVALRTEMITKMNANGATWYNEAKYSLAASAYMAVACEMLRAFPTSRVNLEKAEMLADAFHRLAVCYEAMNSDLQALRFSRLSCDVIRTIMKEEPKPEYLTMFARITQKIDNLVKPQTNSNNQSL